jgi:KaiC/GvpD/RAD55 family RecA-like ATPase
MLIPKELVMEAKEKLGNEAAKIIADDLKLEQFDEINLKSLCPFHQEETPSFVWNPKDNCFKCFGECGINYGIVDHYMQFHDLTYTQAVEKLFAQTNISYLFGERGIKVDSDYKYPSHEDCGHREQVEEYLATRKISKATLDYADVRQDEHGNIVFHYYDTNDVLTAVKYRMSRLYDKKKEKMPKYWGQKDVDNTAGTLYLSNKADPTEPLVITEGEIDCLSVFEAGWKNVCSIPFGAGKNKDTWIKNNYDWLEQFDSIIIWFDNDAAGVESRREACTRLGTWKTRFVNLPLRINKDGKDIQVKDANAVLFHLGKKAVLDLITDAEEVPVPNVIDLSTAEDFNIETSPGLVTSLGGLNKIVKKFIYGSLLILTGKRGSGKSVFLNQVFVCDALDAGEDVFLYSGELAAPVLKHWIEATMIGREYVTMSPDGFAKSFNPEAKKEMTEWYKGRIWTYDDIDNNIDKILNRAINVTRKFGAKVWILDNLMSLDIGITGDGNQWVKQKDLVVKLVSMASTYGVLIVLVSHPRKVGSSSLDINRRLTADDVAGSGDIGNIAHYILSVHRYTKQERAGELDKRGGYKKGKEPVEFDVAIDVLKNRYTGNIDEVDEYFDYNSYRFYRTPEELWHRYGWNKSTEPYIKTDPNSHGHSIPDGFQD